jgi:N-methylhydantoinase B
MDFSHFRIIGYGLIPDSCGHGKQRGGLGFFRRFQILEDDVNFAIYADRFTISPYGLFGGTDAHTGRGELLRNGKIIPIKSKDAMTLQKGDILTIFTAGGGGYGHPSERPKEEIKRDLEQGYLTDATAKASYEVTA